MDNVYSETVEDGFETLPSTVELAVSMAHAGIELFQYPLPREQKAYQKKIELRADIVIGGHRHCFQRMELYQDKHIFYSLGDGIFDHLHDDVWKIFWSPTPHPNKCSFEVDRIFSHYNIDVIMEIENGDLGVAYMSFVSSNDSSKLRFLTDQQRKKWNGHFENVCRNLREDKSVLRRREQIDIEPLRSLKSR